MISDFRQDNVFENCRFAAGARFPSARESGDANDLAFQGGCPAQRVKRKVQRVEVALGSKPKRCAYAETPLGIPCVGCNRPGAD
jgi:hypothetical protein